MTNYKEEVKGLLLENLYELCYRAHTGVSFSPEKRAVSYIKEYSSILKSDLEELGENQGNYKAKFIDKFSSWMSSKGNCISSMITGGSNFPVRRAEKYNNYEHNAYERFSKWREGYFKAVNRVSTPSPEEDLDRMLVELDKLIIWNENIKDGNKIIRKHIKNGRTDESLKACAKEMEEKVSKEFALSILKSLCYNWQYSYWRGIGPVSTKIKKKREDIQVRKNRILRKDSWEDIIFDGGYITIEDDRVKIYHEDKPSSEIINTIKESGFRWSPHWGCWCRKHTENGIRVVNHLIETGVLAKSA